MADRSTLTLAISNILHNSIRYTPEGGNIEISTHTGDDEVFIDISDSGPGIPEDERVKVFGRFYRLDSSRTSSEGGSGLGLAIAKWAVEANGGKIAFLEPIHPGSRCRITLKRGDT
jgi:signal transduction histidine kinase